MAPTILIIVLLIRFTASSNLGGIGGAYLVRGGIVPSTIAVKIENDVSSSGCVSQISCPYPIPTVPAPNVHGKLCHLNKRYLGLGLRESTKDYYWRVYDPSYLHRIPLDAVQAGSDLNRDNLFIGQANIWAEWGIHPTTISPGKEVWAPKGGPKQAINFVQILCSPRTEHWRFYWLPATHDTLHTVGLDTHIVRGGLDEDHSTYIGRVKHQGNIVVGKVLTHDINNSEMQFIFNKQQYHVKSYEILAYNTTQ